jgi:hypothetical protein
MLRVGCDFDHRIGAGPHQQIVYLAFVLMCEVSDLLWQREDQMEVLHGQQLSLTCCQPSLGGTGLTFWTVAVTARVVGNVLMIAVLAPRNMAPEHRCSTALDGTHHFHLVQVDVPLVCHTLSTTMVAKDIRNLQRLNRHASL